MKILQIVAPTGFQEVEYGVPRKIFEEAGHTVFVASKTKNDATGSQGLVVPVDLTFNEVHVQNFDAIIFIGGPGASGYIEDIDAHMIARDAVEENVVLGAICIAPLILAHAGVLKEKKATVWNSDGKPGKRLEAVGATFTNDDVTVDGKIVTANGPPAAEHFAQKVLEVLNS